MPAHHRTRETKHPLVTGTARLTYYIFEGVLTGFLAPESPSAHDSAETESKLVHILAWSGGAGGSRKLKPSDSANNPYDYALQEDEKNDVRGGPIPPGQYRIHTPAVHPTLKLSAYLEPLQKLPNNRGGFYIHGQGPKGSDGCIVLPDADFHPTMNRLSRSHGGLLVVCQAIDGAFA